MELWLKFAHQNQGFSFWWLSRFLRDYGYETEKSLLLQTYKEGVLPNQLGESDYPNTAEFAVTNFYKQFDSRLKQEGNPHRALIQSQLRIYQRQQASGDVDFSAKVQLEDVVFHATNYMLGYNYGINEFNDPEYIAFIKEKRVALTQINWEQTYVPGTQNLDQDPWWWAKDFKRIAALGRQRNEAFDAYQDYFASADDERLCVFLGLVKENIQQEDRNNYLVDEISESDLNQLRALKVADIRSRTNEVAELFQQTHRYDKLTKSLNAYSKLLNNVRRIIASQQENLKKFIQYLLDVSPDGLRTFIDLLNQNIKQKNEFGYLINDEFCDWFHEGEITYENICTAEMRAKIIKTHSFRELKKLMTKTKKI